MTDQSVKADGGKLRPSLFPWRAINPVLRVLEFGAKKYAAHSWQGVEPERYVDALQRHVIEWGERIRAEGVLCTDAESGLPTLAHIACNALFLLAHPNVDVSVKSTVPDYRILGKRDTLIEGDEYQERSGCWRPTGREPGVRVGSFYPYRRRVQ